MSERTCMFPMDDSENPPLCGAPATEERVVEELVWDLCAEHAAQVDELEDDDG